MNVEAFSHLAELAGWLMSDPVGRARVGRTPHVVIHRQNKACVRYFAPSAEAARRAPLFVCMPLINTWTIFDLLPGKSVVEALGAAGVPVYLLDWGRPGPEDAEQTLSDVIDDILPRALRRAARHARAEGTLGPDDALDTLGYCVGGTFLAVGLARHPGLARRMILLASPVDFSASGRLATWARPETFPLDAVVDGFGNFPKALMASSFAWLRPVGQTAKFRTLLERGAEPDFRDTWAAMEAWNNDNTDFPGEAYREYVRACYFDNALMPGAATPWLLGGRRVDLADAALPALAIAADRDHICPPAAAFGLAQAWGGPVETTTLRGGHVGICLDRALPDTVLAWLDQPRVAP